MAPQADPGIAGVLLKLVQRIIRRVPIRHPGHAVAHLVGTRILAAALHPADSPAVVVGSDDVDGRPLPHAEVGQSLARAFAEFLAVLRCVDFSQAHTYRCPYHKNGQSVAISHADDRAVESLRG